MLNDDQILAKTANLLNILQEKCWDGWKQMGMKKKGKRLVPNCVKEQKPSGKATKPYSSHGIPKDATKAELKAIRSNPNSSKGKKQLAHWKLNMHKESITLGMTAAKALAPMAAKAVATKAAPYAAGAAAAATAAAPLTAVGSARRIWNRILFQFAFGFVSLSGIEN